MKKLIIILFFSMCFNVISAQQKITDDVKHFYAGASITFISGSIVNHYLNNPTKSCLIGFGTGVLIGFGKEYFYDKALNKGVFSYNDLATTIWGAAVGSITLRCMIDLREVGLVPHKKKDKYELRKNIY